MVQNVCGRVPDFLFTSLIGEVDVSLHLPTPLSEINVYPVLLGNQSLQECTTSRLATHTVSSSSIFY